MEADYSIQGRDMEQSISATSYISGTNENYAFNGNGGNVAELLGVVNSDERNSPAARTLISVIAESALFRTAFTRGIKGIAPEFAVSAYGSVEQWLQDPEHGSASIVLLCATGQKATEAVINQGLLAVCNSPSDPHAIVVSDVEQSSFMIAALEKGARGYVPMSLDLEVALGAIKLVKVGGTFMPASGLLQARSNFQAQGAANERAADVLTQRQMTVLEILRQGTPNKLIAYKLNMSEATVKIHVRNMMRRLQARNRTELVCRTNELFAA